MKEYWFQKKPSDWGILKLREIFDVVSEKNHPDERLLSVHQIKGVIYRDEQLQDVMNPSGDISNYKLVKPGDFIISLRSSEGGFEYSYRDWETDRKSTRLNSSHLKLSRMPSSA